MSTITITLSGSAITGLTGTPTKTYTVSDTDLQTLLTWFANSAQATTINLPPTPTNPQILLGWIAWWVSLTIGLVQDSIQATKPPPISIA